jgi:hypothetical protein
MIGPPVIGPPGTRGAFDVSSTTEACDGSFIAPKDQRNALLSILFQSRSESGGSTPLRKNLQAVFARQHNEHSTDINV